jgi:hypothetical protein
LSGRINTSFVERLNLTIRQCVSKLTRRTWGPARYTPELMEHLEWWRSYYHFVRPHESLAVELSKPFHEKGNNTQEIPEADSGDGSRADGSKMDGKGVNQLPLAVIKII